MQTNCAPDAKSTLIGRCQCGAMAYAVTGKPVAAFVCHCRDCQRQSGSAFGMALWIDQAQLHLEGASLQDWTRQTPSGKQMVCRFCPTCGSRLFHQIVGSPYLSIKPGSLDDPSAFAPTSHIWVESKQAWVNIPPQVQVFAGNPPEMGVLMQTWQLAHHHSIQQEEK